MKNEHVTIPIFLEDFLTDDMINNTLEVCRNDLDYAVPLLCDAVSDMLEEMGIKFDDLVILSYGEDYYGATLTYIDFAIIFKNRKQYSLFKIKYPDFYNKRVYKDEIIYT